MPALLKTVAIAMTCVSIAHAQQAPQQPGLLESLGKLLQPQKQAMTDEASVPDRTLAVTGKEHRVALVVGNAAYTQGALVNPVNDARAMARRLRSLGFDVVLRENLKARDIGGVYREFRSKVTPGGVALVFYAGHGIQFKGQNYFPAIDADISSEEDVPLQSLNLGNLLDNMEEAKAGVSLVFLDACRDNPFARRFRSGTRGLAKVEAASGMLIHYATRPGSIASDGEGQNGTYTEALLAQMSAPGVPVELMLKRVANQVVAKTKGKQEPWVEGSLRGDFYFIFQGPTTVQLHAPATDPEAETWAAAEDAKTAEGYQAYLDAYPQGRYAVAARIKLKGLQKPAASAAVAPAPTFAPVTASSASDNPETAMWNEVKASGAREYLDAYLKQYPKGKYVALAKIEVKKLDERDKAQRAKETSEKQQAAERERQEVLRSEQVVWDEAKSATSVTAYASYLERYPRGRYAALAQAALPKLQREAVEREKLEAVKRQQELEQQRVEAEKAAAVELALWEGIKNSTGAEPFQSYLKQYPQGKYVALARTELKKLDEHNKAQREQENARYVLDSHGNDRRSPDTIAIDDEIVARAANRIAEKYGSEAHVSVTAFNRLVLLTGEVPSDAIKADVEKTAANVSGVRAISNELVVAEPSGFGGRSNDAYITSKVKARFVDAGRFNLNHFTVVTEAGRVFLLGLVTQSEANAAVEIARTTGGVRQVVRVFQIIRRD